MLSQVFANSEIVLSLLSMVFRKITAFVAAHHHGRRGVIPHQGGVISVNDRGVDHSRRGVTHASDTEAIKHPIVARRAHTYLPLFDAIGAHVWT